MPKEKQIKLKVSSN